MNYKQAQEAFGADVVWFLQNETQYLLETWFEYCRLAGTDDVVLCGTREDLLKKRLTGCSRQVVERAIRKSGNLAAADQLTKPAPNGLWIAIEATPYTWISELVIDEFSIVHLDGNEDTGPTIEAGPRSADRN